jgi:hypothetical protein
MLQVRRSRLLDVKVRLRIFVHRQILLCFWICQLLVWIIHIEQSQWRESDLVKHPFEEGRGLFVVWFEFSVPGNGSLLLSVLFTYGPIEIDSLSILISPRGTAILTDIKRLSDIVSDSQSISISLLRVVDGDFSRLTTLRKDVRDCNVRGSCEEVNNVDSVVFSLYFSALWTATEIDCDLTLLQQSEMVSWRFMRWQLRPTGELLKNIRLHIPFSQIFALWISSKNVSIVFPECSRGVDISAANRWSECVTNLFKECDTHKHWRIWLQLTVIRGIGQLQWLWSTRKRTSKRYWNTLDENILLFPSVVQRWL